MERWGRCSLFKSPILFFSLCILFLELLHHQAAHGRNSPFHALDMSIAHISLSRWRLWLHENLMHLTQWDNPQSPKRKLGEEQVGLDKSQAWQLLVVSVFSASEQMAGRQMLRPVRRTSNMPRLHHRPTISHTLQLKEWHKEWGSVKKWDDSMGKYDFVFLHLALHFLRLYISWRDLYPKAWSTPACVWSSGFVPSKTR